MTERSALTVIYGQISKRPINGLMARCGICILLPPIILLEQIRTKVIGIRVQMEKRH